MVTDREDVLDAEVHMAMKQVPSKTKELQDWLDREIERDLCDLFVLLGVLGEDGYNDVACGIPPSKIAGLFDDIRARHRGKLSHEREQALLNDRLQLLRVKNDLALLRSAKALEIDIDAIEKWLGVEITVTYEKVSHSYNFPAFLSFLIQKDDLATQVQSLALGQRAIVLTQRVKSVYAGCQTHSGITSVQLSREGTYGGEQACVIFSFEYGVLKIFESSLVFFEKKITKIV